MPTDAEIQLLSHIHRITDVDVRLSKGLTGSPYGVGGDLREPCTEDLNVWLHLIKRYPMLKGS